MVSPPRLHRVERRRIAELKIELTSFADKRLAGTPRQDTLARRIGGSYLCAIHIREDGTMSLSSASREWM